MPSYILVPAALSALLYGLWLTHRAATVLRSAVKTVSVLLLAIGSLIVQGPVALGMALLASAVGDYFLSRSAPRFFLPGLISFAIAHIAYIALFVGMARAVPSGLSVTVVGIFALSTVYWLLPYVGALKGAVLAYVLIIACMALAALALPQTYLMTKIGAIAFLASDSLLAVQLFRLPADHSLQPLFSSLLWALYWGAQCAIVISVLAQGF